MQSLWQDMRYGIRLMFKQPLFTLVIIFTLAICLGANTAIFNLVDTILLKSLPVKEPDRLVQFRWIKGTTFTKVNQYVHIGQQQIDSNTGLTINTSFSQQTFEQFRNRQNVCTELFAFAELDRVNASIDGEAEVVNGLVVSGRYFTGLGVHPLIGRMITDEDDRPDAPGVAVLSYSYWTRRFGANTNVIGKQIRLNSSVLTIIGVTSREFMGTMGTGKAPDVTIPLTKESQLLGSDARLNKQSMWWLYLMGRMKPGVSMEQVHAQLYPIFQSSALDSVVRISSQNQNAHDKTQEFIRLTVTSGRRGNPYAGDLGRSLYLMMVSGGLVLLIACINIAGLLHARGVERQKEMAIRMSIGANRWRLMRQLLAEGILLSILSGALGLLLALWGKHLLPILLFGRGENSPFQTFLDSRMLILTFATTVLTYLLFCIIPAWRINRMNLTSELKSTGRVSKGQAHSWASKSLVIAQLAISFLLLIGAGLFLRTLLSLQQVNLGFNPQNLLLFKIDPSMIGYEGERIANLYQQIFMQIEAVPGVQSVTFSRHPLLSGGSSGKLIQMVGQPNNSDKWSRVYMLSVRSNFFETLEIPVQLGRSFNQLDNQKSSNVVVINQALARKFFPNDNPIGKHIHVEPDNRSEWEIIGVVKDAKYDSISDEFPATLYMPWLQVLSSVNVMNFEVRTTSDPASFIPTIRQAVNKIDSNLPLFDIKTQVKQASQSLADEQLLTSLLTFWSILALALASLGLYGVLSINVAQRTQEIGIRMALGAHANNIQTLIIRQGMTLVGVGVGIGLIASFALTSFMKALLFGVTATDTLTYICIITIFGIISLIACWIPARRATKVNPMLVIKSE
jgi:predicted permease